MFIRADVAADIVSRRHTANGTPDIIIKWPEAQPIASFQSLSACAMINASKYGFISARHAVRIGERNVRHEHALSLLGNGSKMLTMLR